MLFPCTDRDRQCLRSHYFSHKYTKLVSVSGLMLQHSLSPWYLLLSVIVFTSSLSERFRFCWKAFKFSLWVEIHITHRHIGMHTHCFKYHKQMIPWAFPKHLKELFSFIGWCMWIFLRMPHALFLGFFCFLIIGNRCFLKASILKSGVWVLQ